MPPAPVAAAAPEAADGDALQGSACFCVFCLQNACHACHPRMPPRPPPNSWDGEADEDLLEVLIHGVLVVGVLRGLAGKRGKLKI